MDKSAQDKKANHNGNLYKMERRCSVFRFSLYSSVQEQNMPSNLQVHTICNVRFYTKNIILLIKLRIDKLEFDGEYLVFRMKLEYISFSVGFLYLFSPSPIMFIIFEHWISLIWV